MKQLTREEDIAGRTIEAVWIDSSEVVLNLGDDSYFAVTIDRGYEFGEESLVVNETATNGSLSEVGLMDKVEIERLSNLAYAKHKRDVEARDLTELARLKAKYEEA